MDNLSQALSYMALKERGNYEFMLNWDFIPAPQRVSSMGVCFAPDGRTVCMYSPEWVESLTWIQLCAVLQHEIGHVSGLHPLRLQDAECIKTRTIAAEWAVNGCAERSFIGIEGPLTPEQKYPTQDPPMFAPKELHGQDLDTIYYTLLEQVSRKQGGDGKQKPQQLPKRGEGKSGKASGGQASQGGDNPGVIYAGVEPGEANPLDSHDIWADEQCDITVAAAQVLANVTRVRSAFPGTLPGANTTMLEALVKPKVRWERWFRTQLLRAIGDHLSPTTLRPNRRTGTYERLGVIPSAGCRIVALVDVSGSTESFLPLFFSELERLLGYGEILLITWDACKQSEGMYRQGDWKKIKITGLGGTDMSAPVEYLLDSRKLGDVNVMLTDGECSYTTPQRKLDSFLTVVVRRGLHARTPEYGRSIVIDADDV